MPRQMIIAAAAMTGIAFAAQGAQAQRFEGVITMKLSGGLNAMVSAGRGGADRRVPDATGNAGRGRAGRSGDIANDPRAEAMRTAMSGGLQQVEYMTRRGKVRITLGSTNGGAPAAAMIYAPDDGLMYTIFPAMSMYAEMSLADLTAQQARADTAPVPTGRSAPRPPVITHTKQFELIAGHRCEHVTVTSAGAKTDVCMGKGLGAFVMPLSAGADRWNRVMAEENGFPLKVVGTNGQVVMEVTKIERKALAEALFIVPDTYTKMPEFGRRPPG